ncbi:MAG: HAD family hydrolase [Peptococcaceae bacterium]|nr:HAD family hydrolase [Peptococcaceae bacterium]MDH7524185.1 HAD family hydrolase [Peptococcaceae bacterium]
MKAVLFDLDGTLLPVEFNEFFKSYLEAISSYCSCLASPEAFIEELLRCTAIMMRNDGSCTNEELFMKHFLPALKLEKEDVYPVLERFYSTEFKKLKKCVKPSGLPSRVVEAVLAAGREVVLATNPLFPLAAVEERMRWAGIDRFPWRLVTSYETSRACKPNLLYYRDIFERLGLKPEDCWMVGNDREEDLAAGELGVRTFLVTDYLVDKGRSSTQADREGSLQDLLEFILEGGL